MTDASIDERLRALEGMQEETCSNLSALRKSIVEGPNVIDRSMRGRVECPACGCRKILHASRILDRAESFSRPKMALVQPSRWWSAGKGHFEAWVCLGCGLVEWYVQDLDTVPVDGEKLNVYGGVQAASERLDRATSGVPRSPAPISARDDLLARARYIDQRNAALRTELGALVSALLDGRENLDPTMRRQLACPVCGCREILHASEILDRADGPSRQQMSLEQLSWHDYKGVGKFEAWICTSCGKAEWYIPDLSRVKVDEKHRRLLEGTNHSERPVLHPAPLASVPRASSVEELGEALEAIESNVSETASRTREVLETASNASKHTPTLWSQLLCPACGEREVLHSSKVLDRSEVGRDDMALEQPRLLDLRGVGVFEVCICTSCGLVEWRIRDVTGVKPDGKRFRLVEGGGGGATGPYR